MIYIEVEDREGATRALEIQEDIDLNLMETLKVFGYDMRATCGGMALCADCHCLVIKGENNLVSPQTDELITLDTRPDAQINSRLSCQIKVNTDINGLNIRLMGYAD